MMSKSIIVFDLDGTLVDTAPDLVAALNHALVDGGIAPSIRLRIGHISASAGV
jgi:phosphoglycolate phosphatase